MKKLLFVMAGVALMLTGTGTARADCGLCGDLTGDGYVNIVDVTAFVEWYTNFVTPQCPCAADVNCDNAVRVTFNVSGDPEIDDLEYIMNYIFSGGPAPCDPDDDGVPDCDPCN